LYIEKKTLTHEILGSFVAPIVNVFEHTTVVVLHVVPLEWSICYYDLEINAHLPREVDSILNEQRRDVTKIVLSRTK
jgi:hypothetical protein